MRVAQNNKINLQSLKERYETYLRKRKLMGIDNAARVYDERGLIKPEFVLLKSEREKQKIDNHTVVLVRKLNITKKLPSKFYDQKNVTHGISPFFFFTNI